MTQPKTQIIAEMAWAHDGSIDKAIAIMEGAKQAGADAIGIHITDIPTYMVHDYGNGKGKVSAGKESLDIVDYLEQINPGHAEWKTFAAASRKAGIALCVMPNDHASLSFAEEQLEPDYYVLSAAAFVEGEFIDRVAALGRPTLLRVGGATLGEIETTINRFTAAGNDRLVLLHGFQNYPTRLEETNIRQLVTLQQLFGLEVGLADHIDGDDPLARTIPMVALGCGATWIEKHITLDRAEKGEDFESALGPEAFAEFVANIRATETALGVASWGPLSEATQRYRQVSRKRTITTRPLTAGEKVTADDICFKRSDHGLPPNESDALIGRTLARDLPADAPIDWDAIA